MISNADLNRWFAERGGTPDLVVDPDGTRTVRWAGQYLRTRPGYWAGRVLDGHDLSDVVQSDGTLRLDTAGEWRYRALREMPDGFTVYERVTFRPPLLRCSICGWEGDGDETYTLHCRLTGHHQASVLRPIEAVPYYAEATDGD